MTHVSCPTRGNNRTLAILHFRIGWLKYWLSLLRPKRVWCETISIPDTEAARVSRISGHYHLYTHEESKLIRKLLEETK